jgi:hypothetical protein
MTVPILLSAYTDGISKAGKMECHPLNSLYLPKEEYSMKRRLLGQTLMPSRKEVKM